MFILFQQDSSGRVQSLCRIANAKVERSKNFSKSLQMEISQTQGERSCGYSKRAAVTEER
jgi:hypothetical protein